MNSRLFYRHNFQIVHMSNNVFYLVVQLCSVGKNIQRALVISYVCMCMLVLQNDPQHIFSKWLSLYPCVGAGLGVLFEQL